MPSLRKCKAQLNAGPNAVMQLGTGTSRQSITIDQRDRKAEWPREDCFLRAQISAQEVDFPVQIS